MKPAKREARFWIRLSEVEKAALKRLAIQRDVTASQLVRHAIRGLVQAQGAAKR